MDYLVFLHKLVVLLVLSVAANLDNLGVGIAYGMGRSRISGFSNFLIALLSGGLTFAAMAFGKWVVQILPVAVANGLGAVIIIGVGIWVYWESVLDPLWDLARNRLWQKLLTTLAKLFPFLTQAKKKTNKGETALSHNISSNTIRRQRSSELVNLKETLILGVSLALNAMAGGFGASLAGHNSIVTSVGIGLFSYITIAAGQRVSGTYLSKSLGPLSQKISGLLLIAIGVYELFF